MSKSPCVSRRRHRKTILPSLRALTSQRVIRFESNSAQIDSMSTEIRITSFVFSLLSLLLSCAPASASPASALGPQLPIVEPRDGFVGRLHVSPPSGPAGTTVTITAERLPANEEFVLAWRTVVGAWNVSEGEYYGREFKVVAYEIGKFNSNSAGSLTAMFVAPEDFGFVHDIVLQQRDRLLTQAAFSLDMTVKISPESGPPGTRCAGNSFPACRRLSRGVARRTSHQVSHRGQPGRRDR